MTDGRTIMKSRNWFDARYVSPTKSGMYDVLTANNRHECLSYSTIHGAWNEYDSLPRKGDTVIVGAWAYRESTQEILNNLISK